MNYCPNCGIQIMAARKPKITDQVMNEMFNYGGEAATRSQIMRHLKKTGANPQQVDRYMQGLEHSRKMARTSDPKAYNKWIASLPKFKG